MAFGKSKPKVPMYQTMKDTPWITRNRDLNTDAYDNLSRDWNNVNVFDDATKQQLNAYNDSIYNRAVSDFDRDYAQTMNKYMARDYNRFGTTGASSSLLTRDNYNLAQQRKLADMEYNRAINYEDMLDRELARRYNWLNANNQLFNTTGKITQKNDLRNWLIQQQNKDRQYMNDIQQYNDRNVFGKTLGTLGSVALGLTPLGPLGYMGGQALTSGLFGDAQNLLGGASGATNINTNGLYDALGYYGAKNDYPAWMSGRLQGDQIADSSTPWYFNWGDSDSIMDSLRDSDFYQRLFGRRS